MQHFLCHRDYWDFRSGKNTHLVFDWDSVMVSIQYYVKSFSIFISGKDADLLIHEATFEDELQAEAVAKKHRFKLNK